MVEKIAPFRVAQPLQGPLVNESLDLTDVPQRTVLVGQKPIPAPDLFTWLGEDSPLSVALTMLPPVPSAGTQAPCPVPANLSKTAQRVLAAGVLGEPLPVQPLGLSELRELACDADFLACPRLIRETLASVWPSDADCAAKFIVQTVADDTHPLDDVRGLALSYLARTPSRFGDPTGTQLSTQQKQIFGHEMQRLVAKKYGDATFTESIYKQMFNANDASSLLLLHHANQAMTLPDRVVLPGRDNYTCSENFRDYTYTHTFLTCAMHFGNHAVVEGLLKAGYPVHQPWSRVGSSYTEYTGRDSGPDSALPLYELGCQVGLWSSDVANTIIFNTARAAVEGRIPLDVVYRELCSGRRPSRAVFLRAWRRVAR